MDPLTMFLLSSLVSGGSALIGGSMQQSATKKAQEEARGLNNRMLDSQDKQNAFSNRMSTANLGLSKQAMQLNKDRFAEEKFASNYGITKDMVDQVEKLLSTNIALKNNVLKTWSMA